MTEPQQQDTELTMSERFTGMVQAQFEAEMGVDLKWDATERRLAQHLYIKADQQLAVLEAKRLDRDNANNTTPIVWNNVNISKMALDAVHRVALGLDALIPNHIHVIPYWNRRLTKYDVDLRIGYMGQDYIRRQLAIDPPIDIRYELVHENDTFEPQPKDSDRDVEGYIFQITKPWDRGSVVGGFGYVMYGDPKKNQLILVTQQDFTRARTAAQTGEFWSSSEREMQLKTVVHRTTSRIALDAAKINARSYAYVEAQEYEEVPLIETVEEENMEPLTVDQPESEEMGVGEKEQEELAEAQTELGDPGF